MIRRNYLVLIHIMILCTFPSLSTALGVSGCGLPPVNFKLSYLDQVISNGNSPSDEEFIASKSPNDAVRGQLYAWYAYKNPEVAKEYFTKDRVSSLMALRSDAVNTIIWMYMNNHPKKKGYELIHGWYMKISSREKSKIDYFSGKNDRLDEDDFSKEVDPDITLFKGIFADRLGENTEAFYYYRRLASYGFQGGLVSLSLIIPRINQDPACLDMAKYYVRLSGALKVPSWFDAGKGDGGN